MSCEDQRQAIRDVALGEPVSLGLETHLETCPFCRVALENDRRLLGRIEGELEDLLSVPASPGFVARVRAHIREREDVAAVTRWWLPAAAGAALLVGVTLVDRVPRGAPPPKPADRTVRARPVEPPPAPDLGPVAPATSITTEPEAKSPTKSPAPPATRGAASPARVAPEVLIAAEDREALRRFVAGRGRWSVSGEPARVGLVDAPETTSADWEMPESEDDVVLDWELDAWPLAPGD